MIPHRESLRWLTLAYWVTASIVDEATVDASKCPSEDCDIANTLHKVVLELRRRSSLQHGRVLSTQGKLRHLRRRGMEYGLCCPGRGVNTIVLLCGLSNGYGAWQHRAGTTEAYDQAIRGARYDSFEFDGSVGELGTRRAPR